MLVVDYLVVVFLSNYLMSEVDSICIGQNTIAFSSMKGCAYTHCILGLP